MNLEWMAWTLPTAIFFIIIALILCAMTVWEIVSPAVERRGFLPIATTRGDRLFISLLGSAFIFIAWLFFAGPPLWWPLLICLVWALFVFRHI